MKEIEVKEFQEIFERLNATAMQLFEGVGLSHLITTDIRFKETKSGLVCKVKHLQRSGQGIKEIERVFVRVYRDENFDYYGEEENGERINFFLIKTRALG